MPHPDLETLLNELVPVAQQMLSKHGAFMPFGMTMSLAGEVAMHAAYDGEEQPEAEQLIDLLTRGLREQAAAGQLRAAGVCIDVRVTPPGQTEKTDAIHVGLEHQSGEAVDVYVPYRKGFMGKLRYGELFGAGRTPEFFG